MFRKLSKEEFVRRSEGVDRVVVFKECCADRETPVAVLSRLKTGEDAFLLESVRCGSSRSRYSYLGVDPQAVVTERDGVVERTDKDGRTQRLPGTDAFDALRAMFAETKTACAPELPPFQGGAAGYVAYDAVNAFEPRVRAPREAGRPTKAFLLIDTTLVFDNVRDTVTVVRLADVAGRTDLDAVYEETMAAIDAVCARFLSAESIARAAETKAECRVACGGRFESEMTRDEFRAVVGACKDAIRDGEVIQIVPSRSFSARSDVSPLAAYRALRTLNPSPYNFLMSIGATALVGSSPEELVKLSGRKASVSPIAGTRPRGRDEREDAAMERGLAADEKERAEHLMLVDLGRNDLSRVCEPGSVNVLSLARVERYSHVMHLVSDIEGVLSGEHDAFALFKAVFPAGTLSGAPKVRAMEILSRLEKSPRGVYGGAAGYFSVTGEMDFAIVIRTLEMENGRVRVRAGAGVVADSDPDREFEETFNKAKAVFEAIAAAEEFA
jgi:anthranilate synthase component 1